MSAVLDLDPGVILHLVPASAWAVDQAAPYAPASLESEGFVHCSPDVATTLAVATAFYADAPRPVLALLLEESRLSAPVVREAASPAPPPGVGEDVLFPHVRGPLDRDGVVEVRQVVWDGSRAIGLEARPAVIMGGKVRGLDGRDE